MNPFTPDTLVQLAQEPVLALILFLLPGFVGFSTFITFLPIFENTTRWRWHNINWIQVLTCSFIWSFLVYSIFFNYDYPHELIENMSVNNSLLLILFSVGFAELFTIALMIVTIMTQIFLTFGNFLLYKKPSYHHKVYFSWKRFILIWKQEKLRKFRGIMLDKRYEEIRNARINRNILEIKLKNKVVLTGRISKRRSDMSYDMSQFKLTTKRGASIIRLRDVDTVSLVTQRRTSKNLRIGDIKL